MVYRRSWLRPLWISPTGSRFPPLLLRSISVNLSQTGNQITVEDFIIDHKKQMQQESGTLIECVWGGGDGVEVYLLSEACPCQWEDGALNSTARHASRTLSWFPRLLSYDPWECTLSGYMNVSRQIPIKPCHPRNTFIDLRKFWFTTFTSYVWAVV